MSERSQDASEAVLRMRNPRKVLRHHVTGAIERGEKVAVVEQPQEWEVVAWWENGGSSTVRGYSTELEALHDVKRVRKNAEQIGPVRLTEVLEVKRDTR